MTSWNPGRNSMLAAAIALTLATSPASAAVASGSVHETPSIDAPGQGAQHFIVKFRQDTAPAIAATVADATLAGAVSRSMPARAMPTSLRVARRTGTGARTVVASRALNAAESRALVEELGKDPQVEYAQIDYRLHTLGTLPDDPALPTYQWDMLDTVGGIHAPVAWETTRGEGVVIAVLDTGVLQHSDLAANLVAGYDLVTLGGMDGDGRDPDATDPGTNADGTCSSPSSWHGTHVAGTVAAIGNNAQGIAGTAWRAQVQPVRVLGACGSGAISDIADGVVWASGGHLEGIPDNPRPADVINMSLGGDVACTSTPDLQKAIDDAVSRGTTVVVAAGNSGRDVSGATPAGCNNVIAVGATDFQGNRASYSSFGLGVAVSAPGGDDDASAGVSEGLVWSTGDSGETTAHNDNILISMAGTSMAAPHVSGIVALMQSAAVAATGQALTPLQVSTMLKQSARPFPMEQSQPMGNGIADASRAVLMATGQPLPEPPTLALVNGVALAGQSGESQLSRTYSIEVPAGARTLNLRTMGGTGDVTLYASAGVVPEVDNAQYRSGRPGTAEAIVINRPAPGTWYLRVAGESQYRGVSVLGLAR